MLRKHIERIVRFPVTTILLAIIATAFFAFQFKSLHMVLDPKAILPQDHPYVMLNNEIEKQFGGSRVVLIGIASKDGDIFNPGDIEKIKGINEEVRKIPGILENNIVSIADKKVKYVKAEGDTLEIRSLLDGIESTPEGMAELKSRVYSNPMFVKSLVSEDGTVAAIILDFKGGAGDWWKKAEGGAGEKSEVRIQNSEFRSKKIENERDVIARRPKADEAIPNSATVEIASGLKSLAMTGSNAWAQEDWRKWQAGEGEKGQSAVSSQQSESSSQEIGDRSQKLEEESQKAEEDGERVEESPDVIASEAKQSENEIASGNTSPRNDTDKRWNEAQGDEEDQGDKWPAEGESQWPAAGEGQWPAGGEAGWPAGGEGGWPGAGDEGAGWEQWYVSDSTIHRHVQDIVDKYRDSNTEIYVGGLPVALAYLEADSWRMSRYIYPLALVIIMFVLYFAFRSIQGMFLPIVCALLSVVWAVGLMGMFRIPLDPWNMMTPILILAVAAGHSVQILKRYYEELDKSSEVEGKGSQVKGEEKTEDRSPATSNLQPATFSERWDREVSKQAVRDSLTKIGPVMITAGIVAAASFASLLTFQLKTFQSFGLFTAFGILSALVLEMTFIPAARSLMRPPKKVSGRRLQVKGHGNESPATYNLQPTTFLDRFLIAISRLVSERGWVVWIGLILIIGISIYGIRNLTVINSLKGLFFESTQFRKDDAALNRYFGGTATFYIHIEGEEPDSLKDPAVLRAIEAMQREIEAIPEVGKTQSYVDYVKAMNQSMHGGDMAFRTIPDEQSTISEYLFLFSISGSQGEMDRFLDYQYQKSVVWVFLRDDSTVLGENLITIVNKYMPDGKTEVRSQKSEDSLNVIASEAKQSENEIASGTMSPRNDVAGDINSFPPGIKVGVAGSIPVMMALNQTMVSGKIWNILQIAAIVFVITSIVLRSIIGGILVLLPLAIAVLVNFGVLGIAGIGLGVGTAAISAMAVGFGADYSIYLLYRLREEMNRKTVIASEAKQSENKIASVASGNLAMTSSQKPNLDAAIRRTLLTAGKAIIFVALALSLGGLTLLFTGYYLHMEGFLVPLAMLTSSLATLILLPAVVRVVKPGFIIGNK